MSTAAEKVVIVKNPQGIHMRPADILSKAAMQFESSIEIEKQGFVANCKSIMDILMLGADQGTELSIRANGVDAKRAVDELSELFNNGLDEFDSEVASPDPV